MERYMKGFHKRMSAALDPVVYVRIRSDTADCIDYCQAFRDPVAFEDIPNPPLEDTVWRFYRLSEAVPSTARELLYTSETNPVPTFRVFADPGSLAENLAGWFVAQHLGFEPDEAVFPRGALYFIGTQKLNLLHSDAVAISGAYANYQAYRVDKTYRDWYNVGPNADYDYDGAMRRASQADPVLVAAPPLPMPDFSYDRPQPFTHLSNGDDNHDDMLF